MGSGLPFPVPWRLIPSNVYLNAYLMFHLAWMPQVAAKRKQLTERGVPDPIRFYGLQRPDTPWLTQTLPGASTPVDLIPQNVTCTGPIVLSAAHASEQDPELLEWIRQRPTVLINLGSMMTYSISQAQHMISAITEILSLTEVQILWKLEVTASVQWDWESAVRPLLETHRVRVMRWLTVDPTSLLESGHIVAFVTHGGANGYHEAIAYV